MKLNECGFDYKNLAKEFIGQIGEFVRDFSLEVVVGSVSRAPTFSVGASVRVEGDVLYSFFFRPQEGPFVKGYANLQAIDAERYSVSVLAENPMRITVIPKDGFLLTDRAVPTVFHLFTSKKKEPRFVDYY